MARNYIDGRNFILFYNTGDEWTALGASMDCVLTVTQEAVETMPTDDWRALEYIRGRYTWAVSVSAMIWLEDGAINDPTTLLGLDPDSLQIRIATVPAHKNRDQETYHPNGYYCKTGKVLVTSITQSMPLAGKATYSLELQGVGVLEDEELDTHGNYWYDADTWIDDEEYKE